MPLKDFDQLQKELEDKEERIKKRTKMKISGSSVKELAKIIKKGQKKSK